MPLQNRVTPFSTIEAVECRGLVMGNRGKLGFGVGAVLAEPEVGEAESAQLVYSDGREDEEAEADRPRYLLPQRAERGER